MLNFFPYKTCLSKTLLLKMWELSSNQIYQIVTPQKKYIIYETDIDAHCHSYLTSFSLLIQPKLVSSRTHLILTWNSKQNIA